MKRLITLAAMALACSAATANTPDAAGELQFAKAECKAPTIPSHSVSPDGARRVERSVRNWRNCFSGWKDKVMAAYPEGTPMPEAVAKDVADAFAQDDKIDQSISAWMTASREYNKGLGLPRDIKDRMERDREEYIAGFKYLRR